MHKLATIAIAVAWLTSMPVRAASDAETAKEVLAMERHAMDGWITGNPEAALALADAEISFFHIMTEKRLDGKAALQALYEQYRGRPLYDSYDMVDSKVVVSGDVAVLTYLCVFHNGATLGRWNATKVYQHKKEGWRVIHEHWSQTKPAA